MTNSTFTTSISRGDVVITLWPNKYTSKLKPRPALVVQSGEYVADDGAIILVPVTSDVSLPLLGCRISVLKGTSDHVAMNIQANSLILPDKVFHVPLPAVDRVIGYCPIALMAQVEDGLRFVLGL